MNWEPIKNAPRDGTWVLLKGGEIDLAWDHDAAKPPMVIGQHRKDEYWQFAWYDGGYYGEYYKPTHFCRLEP